MHVPDGLADLSIEVYERLNCREQAKSLIDGSGRIVDNSEVGAYSQIAITLSEDRRTATTVTKRLSFREDRSEARRAKRPNVAIVAVFALALLSP